MDAEYQQLIADAACHQARLVGQEWMIAAGEHTRPSVLYRPALSRDGDQYCALYGADLQEGCAGFGPTPEAAMRDFDTRWSKA